jgi:hypothetical protein
MLFTKIVAAFQLLHCYIFLVDSRPFSSKHDLVKRALQRFPHKDASGDLLAREATNFLDSMFISLIFFFKWPRNGDSFVQFLE